MKIALVQLDYHVGNFAENTAKIIRTLEEAKVRGADLAVYAELAVCGYPPRDFLEFDHFIDECEKSVQEIASHCVGIAAIVGSPSRNPDIKGKDLFNSAWFMKDGKVAQIVSKTLLPTYDVFDEYRYFEPSVQHQCIELNGCKIALTVCEDLWNVDENPLYVYNPMDDLIKEQPDFAVNIAASPFSSTHDQSRIDVLRKNAATYKIPFFYVNHTGAQTELIFDGGSMAVNAKGDIYKLPVFEECMQIYDLKEVKEGKGAKTFTPKGKYELIYLALQEGINDYFTKSGLKTAALGMSGGIDSALVLAIAVKALGKDNVVPVMMPSQFSSSGSVNDSEDMIRRLGTPCYKVPIKVILDQYETTLSPAFGGMPKSLTEENLQARIRGVILMAFTNQMEMVLLNTSNKSEFAVGYSTMYGDSIGAISILGDLYKTEVYELAAYINETEGDIIPKAILEKAPSAELRPGQKDTDSLPPYDVLDAILFQYINLKKGPEEIIQSGFDRELVLSVLRRVNRNEYKRYQAPPILRVSEKSFGAGRRFPIVGKYLE
jgi:NAD+ synthase (glutamine-hydrolysing)